MNQISNMNELIYDYQPYILNENNMISYLKYKLNTTREKEGKPTGCFTKINNTKINNTKINNTKINDTKINDSKATFFIPKEEDTLFWCYYIILNGDGKYQMLNIKNSLIAKQIKIDYVSKIRENKQILKTYKFDSITSIESNLANDNNINIKTVMSLCVINKINLIFISRKTYFELLMNDTEPIYIIRELEFQSKYSKKYGFEIANSNLIDNIRTTLYKIDNLDKPIKALSYYKVKDLTDICEKLSIDIINSQTGKNKTKNELYESIIQYL
jgi:hypothetical protein